MLELSEVKLFLRVDANDEDGYISVLILLSKEMVENYLRSDIPNPLPESIKQAMFMIISHFFEKRDGEPVPIVVYRLLDSYRQEMF